MTTARIDARFAALKAENRAAFVAYVMAGDPDTATAAKILAGLPDERPDQGQGGAGAATLAGLKVAREHGMQAPTAPEGAS